MQPGAATTAPAAEPTPAASVVARPAARRPCHRVSPDAATPHTTDGETTMLQRDTGETPPSVRHPTPWRPVSFRVQRDDSETPPARWRLTGKDQGQARASDQPAARCALSITSSGTVDHRVVQPLVPAGPVQRPAFRRILRWQHRIDEGHRQPRLGLSTDAFQRPPPARIALIACCAACWPLIQAPASVPPSPA